MTSQAGDTRSTHDSIRFRTAAEVPPLALGIKIKRVRSPLRRLRRRRA